MHIIMIMDRTKAIRLLHMLDTYCKQEGIYKGKGMKFSHNRSMRLIWLAKQVMDRYHGVVLEEEGVRYLCNNPKYLKKWAMLESLRKVDPLKSTYKI